MDHGEIIREVESIYGLIDRQRAKTGAKCAACGKCCDFHNYGHKLFVTSVELAYLKVRLGQENMRQMRNGACGFNEHGRCSIYPNRFAGCRIYSCKSDPAAQNELTEAVLRKIKKLCRQTGAAYHYSELSVALREACAPAGRCESTPEQAV